MPFNFSLAQPRLAILDFNGEAAAATHLRKIIKPTEFVLVDSEQMQIARQGAGYNGSLNLTVEEARALGLSIGCDYYVLGLARVLRRLISEKEFYFDVFVAAFLVETQSGKLLKFSLAKTQASKEIAAHQQLLELTEKIWLPCADVLKSPAPRTQINQAADAAVDVYDLASDEATRLNIKPPQFFRRLKPMYPETAALANVLATIECKVIFQSDGQIGAVEIIRWGGFGLDEAALATIKQLRFAPAQRNGQPVHVSAIVRYNFGKEEQVK